MLDVHLLCAEDDTLDYDPVRNPGHYTAGRSIEPIDAIEDWQLDFYLGNVVKYVSRAGRKGSAVEDLKKAQWYLDRAITKYKTKEKYNGA
jgi:hypothetical protein